MINYNMREAPIEEENDQQEKNQKNQKQEKKQVDHKNQNKIHIPRTTKGKGEREKKKKKRRRKKRMARNREEKKSKKTNWKYEEVRLVILGAQHDAQAQRAKLA